MKSWFRWLRLEFVIQTSIVEILLPMLEYRVCTIPVCLAMKVRYAFYASVNKLFRY